MTFLPQDGSRGQKISSRASEKASISLKFGAEAGLMIFWPLNNFEGQKSDTQPPGKTCKFIFSSFWMIFGDHKEFFRQFLLETFFP